MKTLVFLNYGLALLNLYVYWKHNTKFNLFTCFFCAGIAFVITWF